MKEKGWVYTMHVTFIEIYNEQVFCLLRAEGSEKNDLAIKQDKKGKTFVDGANKIEIDPTDLKVCFQTTVKPLKVIIYTPKCSTFLLAHKAIDDLMDTAALHRATASTDMNAVSSRSHSIFTLHLTGRNDELGAKIMGTLHLCDLAG